MAGRSTSPSAAEAMLDALLAAGVDRIFCNPGTTELALLTALAERPQLRYSLTLHEGTAVAAATGYALATGRPAVALVHAMPGVGNALSMYANAARCGVPVLLIAGNQDRRHQFHDPIVYADLVDIMRSVGKYSWEARTPEEIPAVTTRALTEAMTAPAGAVFLSIPMDLLPAPVAEPADPGPLRRPVLAAAPPEEVDRLCDLLLDANAPVVVTGDLAGVRGVGPATADLAQLLGAPVHWAPVAGLASFPSGNEFFRGPLLAHAASFQRTFGTADLVLAIGADMVPPILYKPIDLIPATVRQAVITESPADRVGVMTPELSLYGDLPATVERLVTTLGERLAADPGRRSVVAERRTRQQAAGQAMREKLRRRASPAAPDRVGPLPPAEAISAVLEAAPQDVIVVDEAVSSSGWIPLLGRFHDPGSYLSLARGGALGYAAGVALGAHLASGRPTLVIIGDGALMYTPQGLWSLAAAGLPVVTCVLNNGGYQILRDFIKDDYFRPANSDSAASRAVPGTDPMLSITSPSLDITRIAEGYGVRTSRVDSVGSCRDAVVAAFKSGQPWLIDIPVRRPDST